MKKVIRLTESDLHRIVRNSVKKILKESGDTNRGRYMIGRVAGRASKGGYKSLDTPDGRTIDNAITRRNKTNPQSFDMGWEDEQKTDNNRNRRIQWNYDVEKMKDMENVGKKFIDFIEHYNGGVLLQTIVDYKSGNQTGTPCSPLPSIIPEFEDEVLGYECTPEMKEAIKKAFNQWWVYAQDELI